MQKNTPPAITVSFSGTIANAYEELLGSFLFEPYALDLVQRIPKTPGLNVLELACGTGQVTKKLIQHLPGSAHVMATDVEADMLARAQQHIAYENLSWQTADMMNIPFEDNRFDLIVCQFGVMLVPDKLKALNEMHRVLKPGGKLIFSVWGLLEENDVWHIAGEVISRYISFNPITADPGPFSMNNNTTEQWLEHTGFTNIKTTAVNKTGEIARSALAAEGFINGLPVHIAIQKKDPALLPVIQAELENEFINKIGNNPLRTPLSAWVFKAIK